MTGSSGSRALRAATILSLPQLDPVLRAFQAGGDRGLAATRFAQAVLKLLDVLLVSAQGVVEDGDFLLELVAHVGSLLLLDEGCAGKIFAIFRQRQGRLLAPVGLQLVQLDRVTVHFLLVRDRACRAGADFHQGFLHLEDDHADHLLRIIRLVEHVVEIGGDDIAGSAENAHQGCSG